jgi:hypothetical protein
MNYLSIFLGGLGAWILGALWYSPVLFGKAWQKELGFKEEDLKGANMPLIFGGSFIAMLLMSFGLSFVISAHSDITWTHGFFHGCMMGVLIAAMSMGINYLYQRKSLKLYLIDAVYQVLLLGVSGAIMAAMA